jgi:nucleoside-diphosphate-sugar epimerase
MASSKLIDGLQRHSFELEPAESPDPLFEFRKVNTQGTVALAAEAAAQGVRRFVFLSSIKVNGERTTGTPYTASDPPDPQDDYGLSKFEAEVGLHAVHETAGIEVTVVRTPLVYGPNVGGNFLRILGLAGSRMPLPLAAVRNRRTMVAVWNLVDLLMQAATLPEAAGALVLAGDSASPSTADLVRAMRIASGMKPRLFAVPVSLMTLAGRLTGRGDVVSRLVDSLEVEAGSSSNEWRWSPSMSFEDAIDCTVAWFQSRGAAPAERDASAYRNR